VSGYPSVVNQSFWNGSCRVIAWRDKGNNWWSCRLVMLRLRLCLVLFLVDRRMSKLALASLDAKRNRLNHRWLFRCSTTRDSFRFSTCDSFHLTNLNLVLLYRFREDFSMVRYRLIRDGLSMVRRVSIRWRDVRIRRRRWRVLDLRWQEVCLAVLMASFMDLVISDNEEGKNT